MTNMKLRPYQNDALEQLIETSDKGDGIICMPTRSGKSVVIKEFISLCLSDTSSISVAVVVSPRRKLNRQLTQDIHSTDAKHIIFQSKCAHERSTLEEIDSDGGLIEASITRDETTLKALISGTKKQKIVITTTLKSVEVLFTVFAELGLRADIVIFDEAHNLVSAGNEQIISEGSVVRTNSAARRYFTATMKGARTSDYGMNNTARFGPIIFKVSPSYLIKLGYILRLHLSSISMALKRGETKPTRKALRDITLKAIRSHVEFNDREQPDIAASIIISAPGVEAGDCLYTDLLGPLKKRGFKLFRIFNNTTDGEAQFDVFKECTGKRAIIHYDMLSEGITVEGATCALILRTMSPIKFIQTANRPAGLAKNNTKRCGHVIIMHNPADINSENGVNTMVAAAEALRAEDYDPFIEDYEPTEEKGSPEEDTDDAGLEKGGQVDTTGNNLKHAEYINKIEERGLKFNIPNIAPGF